MAGGAQWGADALSERKFWRVKEVIDVRGGGLG